MSSMYDKIEFKEEKVSKEILTKILEAGNSAPTGKGLQPQKIYIIQTKKRLELLKKVTKDLHGASTVVMVCGDTNIAYTKNHCTSYRADAILVTLHMIIEATKLNVDNYWIKDYEFDINKAQEILGIESNIIPVSLLILGYKTDDSAGFKATDFNVSSLASQRKDLDEIVKFI